MSESTSSGGIGFSGALFLLFLGLKLTHYVSWSWWWVFSPLWIGACLVLGLLIAVVIFSFLAALFS